MSYRNLTQTIDVIILVRFSLRSHFREKSLHQVDANACIILSQILCEPALW